MPVQVLTLLDLGFQFLMQFELLSIIIIFKQLLFVVGLVNGDFEDLD
jgi:hypothetical protein